MRPRPASHKSNKENGAAGPSWEGKKPRAKTLTQEKAEARRRRRRNPEAPCEQTRRRRRVGGQPAQRAWTSPAEERPPSSQPRRASWRKRRKVCRASKGAGGRGGAGGGGPPPRRGAAAGSTLKAGAEETLPGPAAEAGRPGSVGPAGFSREAGAGARARRSRVYASGLVATRFGEESVRSSPGAGEGAGRADGTQSRAARPPAQGRGV